MLQIRHSMFETNSSSTHSVSICGSTNEHKLDYSALDTFVDPEDKLIHISFGQFGHGYEEYEDAYTKLQYLLIMALETHKHEFCHEGDVSIEDFYNLDEFILLESIITSYVKDCKGLCVDDVILKHEYESEDNDGNPCKGYYITCNGYIDHQSHEHYDCMIDFLNDWELTIEEFVFNENVQLIIDCDNN